MTSDECSSGQNGVTSVAVDRTECSSGQDGVTSVAVDRMEGRV